MGTRTYSRRAADGTRRPTALGIRTGKFREVRESGTLGGGYQEMLFPVGGNDVTYLLNSEVFEADRLTDDFVKLNNALPNAESVYITSNMQEGDKEYFGKLDEESRNVYIDVAESISDSIRDVIEALQSAHTMRRGSFSDDFQYRETRSFINDESFYLDNQLYKLNQLANYLYTRDEDRNMRYPFTLSAQRRYDTVEAEHSLLLTKMRDVIENVDRWVRRARNEGNADIADIADPVEAMSSQAKRIFNALLAKERDWLDLYPVNQWQNEEGLTRATSVEYNIQPFAIDEE